MLKQQKITDQNDTIIPTDKVDMILGTVNDRLIASKVRVDDVQINFQVSNTVLLIHPHSLSVFTLKIDVHVAIINFAVLLHPCVYRYVSNVVTHSIKLQLVNAL